MNNIINIVRPSALSPLWEPQKLLDYPPYSWPYKKSSYNYKFHPMHFVCSSSSYYYKFAGVLHAIAGLSTLSTVLSSFLSSMLPWLGRGLPVAEQKILGLEFRFHSKLPSKSKIWGARSAKKKERKTPPKD